MPLTLFRGSSSDATCWECRLAMKLIAAPDITREHPISCTLHHCKYSVKGNVAFQPGLHSGHAPNQPPGVVVCLEPWLRLPHTVLQITWSDVRLMGYFFCYMISGFCFLLPWSTSNISNIINGWYWQMLSLLCTHIRFLFYWLNIQYIKYFPKTYLWSVPMTSTH